MERQQRVERNDPERGDREPNQAAQGNNRRR